MSDFALSDPVHPSRSGRRGLTAALALGAAWWAVFLLALEPGNLLRAASVGHPLPFGSEALRIAGASLLGAASAPAVLLLTRRFPVKGAGRWRNGAAQAAGIAALAVGLIVVSCLLAGLGDVGDTDIPGQLAENGPVVAFCLGGFVAVAHALQFGRRGAREDRAAPPASAKPYLSEIPVKTRGGLVVVRLDEVDWIETQGNYLALHTGRAVHLIRETSARLEPRLDPERFARVHRRTLVALDRIRELRPLRGRDAELRLADGTRLRLSRSYRGRIQSQLKGAAR